MPVLVSTDNVSSIKPDDLPSLSRRRVEWQVVSLVANALAYGVFSAERGMTPALLEPVTRWAGVLAEAKRQALFWAHPCDTGTGWTQSSSTEVPRAFVAAFELTNIERDYLIRSVISSEALEGIECSYSEASRLLDEVLLEPLIDIG